MVSSKVLLVTGGGRGIGAAISVLAGATGWSVAVNYLNNNSAAENVVDKIAGLGGTAVAIQGDIGSVEDVQHIFSEVDSVFGRLDGVVNNAAIIPESSSFLDVSFDQLVNTINTNLIGSIVCSREAAIRMSTSLGGGGGSIINISSEAGKFGGTGVPAYAASKSGLNTFTIGLARELAPNGIHVNAVSPGIIDTESNSSVNSKAFATRMASLPMGRMGTPHEVATAVMWLLSEEASYISGAILPITGGR